MFSSAVFLKLLAMLRGNAIQLIQNEWKGIFGDSPPRLVITYTHISPPLAPSFKLFLSSLLFVFFPLSSWKIVSISSLLSECQTFVIRFWCGIKDTVYYQINNICLRVRLLPGGAPAVGSFLLWPRAASDFQPPAVGRLHHVGLSVVGPTHTHTQKHARTVILLKVKVDSPQKNLTLFPPPHTVRSFSPSINMLLPWLPHWLPFLLFLLHGNAGSVVMLWFQHLLTLA